MRFNMSSIKMIIPRLLALAFVAILIGCDSSVAPRFMQTKEMQCLQSAALTFKDPTSLKVVTNLGNRKYIGDIPTDSFWIRYAAKNSYGAYGSANMLCSTAAGNGWTRDKSAEFNIVLKAQLHNSHLSRTRMNQRNAEVQSCKNNKYCLADTEKKYDDVESMFKSYRYFSVDEMMAKNQRIAEEQVLESLDDLSWIPIESKPSKSWAG